MKAQMHSMAFLLHKKKTTKNQKFLKITIQLKKVTKILFRNLLDIKILTLMLMEKKDTQ